MPRHNDNATSPSGGKQRNQHHKGNHSSSHGKGGDRKIKTAKQIAGQSRHAKPVKRKTREDTYEPA